MRFAYSLFAIFSVVLLAGSHPYSLRISDARPHPLSMPRHPRTKSKCFAWT
jgi:hypothetical protein